MEKISDIFKSKTDHFVGQDLHFKDKFKFLCPRTGKCSLNSELCPIKQKKQMAKLIPPTTFFLNCQVLKNRATAPEDLQC